MVRPRRVDALVVVDVQVAFVSGDAAVPAAGALLERVTDLVTRARAAGVLAGPVAPVGR